MKESIKMQGHAGLHGSRAVLSGSRFERSPGSGRGLTGMRDLKQNSKMILIYSTFVLSSGFGQDLDSITFKEEIHKPRVGNLFLSGVI